MSRKENSGFVALLPLLVVAAIVVLAFSVKNNTKNLSTTNEAVLSESSSNDRSSEGKKGSGSESRDSGRNGSGEQGASGGSSGGTEVKTSVSGSEPGFTKPAPAVSDIGLPNESELPEIEDFPEVKDSNEAEAVVHTETETGIHATTIKIQNGDTNFEVKHPAGDIKVQGDIPLVVNNDTNELTASTSSGVKTVATLPDEAIQNLITKGVLSSSTGVQLTADKNGELHYQIHGKKSGKLFGLFNISFNKTAEVNVQTGQVVAVDQTSLTKLLDVVTF